MARTNDYGAGSGSNREDAGRDGGKARIDGTRLSVYYVREQIEGRGIDPQTFAAEHDLDVADVHRALTYYYDHPDEMEEIRSRRERLVEEANEDPRIATGPDDLGEPMDG